MTLRTFVAAAALALTASAAVATTPRAMPISLADDGSFSFTFKASHDTAGAFTETFSFDALSGGSVAVGLMSWGRNDRKDIDFVSATLNGHALALGRSGMLDFGTLASTAFTGPLLLTVSGIVAPDFAPGHRANGNYWVALGGQEVVSAAPATPVPEPGAYALMLAGLSAIGFVARRRARR
jgi:hypothetical protein